MFGIVDAIKSFFDFIVDFVGFIIRLLGDMVEVVKLLGKTVISIPAYIGFLPSAVVALFATCLTVVVLYKVLGRT